jgi:hypothetical protein
MQLARWVAPFNPIKRDGCDRVVHADPCTRTP